MRHTLAIASIGIGCGGLEGIWHMSVAADLRLENLHTVAIELFDHGSSGSAATHNWRVNVPEQSALLAFSTGSSRTSLAVRRRHLEDVVKRL